MIIHTSQQLAQYQAVAKLSTAILAQLYDVVKPGVTPLEIDALAEKLCQKNQVIPGFKGVGPANNLYRHATCISVNDTVVHGIPNNRPFQPGDIVKVDFGIIKDGLQTDHCFTLGLAPLTKIDDNLIKVSREAVQTAVKLAVVGNTTGDLGFAMQSVIEKGGCNVAKEFIGHGIGHEMHEAPQLPAYGVKGTGRILQEGLVLCVEAQVLAGSADVVFKEDGWTVKTQDGKKAGMFEYMVVVGREKPIVLTPTLDWAVVR